MNYDLIKRYGAKLYKNDQEALDGQKSSHQAIMDAFEDRGGEILPHYGTLYLSESVFGFEEGNFLKGLTNKAVNVITDKPISMFNPVNMRSEFSGFTAKYYGDKITEECAVIRLGGDNRNTGRIDYRDGQKVKKTERRTYCVGSNFDFDFKGDESYYMAYNKYPYLYNPDYIPNGNAHAFWVDYSEEREDIFSNLHHCQIKGFWENVNTGIKITTKSAKQSLNNLRVDVVIRGFKQLANIDKLQMSYIRIEAQHFRSLNEFERNTIYPFFIKGDNLACDIFQNDQFKDDIGRHNLKGQYHVNNLDLQGQNSLANIIENGKFLDAYADLNNSKLVNHSKVVTLDNLKVKLNT